MNESSRTIICGTFERFLHQTPIIPRLAYVHSLIIQNPRSTAQRIANVATNLTQPAKTATVNLHPVYYRPSSRAPSVIAGRNDTTVTEESVNKRNQFKLCPFDWHLTYW